MGEREGVLISGSLICSVPQNAPSVAVNPQRGGAAARFYSTEYLEVVAVDFCRLLLLLLLLLLLQSPRSSEVVRREECSLLMTQHFLLYNLDTYLQLYAHP